AVELRSLQQGVRHRPRHHRRSRGRAEGGVAHVQTQLRPEERPLSGRRVGAPGRVPGGRRARARVGRQHARWSPCMTTACPALPASVAPGEAPPKRRLPVLSVAALLNEQQSLTAVERFAKLHEDPASSLKERIYRDLVPLERPQAGEQYAFEVDLDACTGCKACVAACHNMNGLDPGELWRNVGLLHGGSAAAPAVRTVTSSCHHCLEPACLLGCPTRAYEKDPVTGIVKHLDDQCFGCEYCTLMCPYDAPKYNRARGIVRKCDMCSARLASGEAPACVQACPNEAIAIRIVAQAAVIESADAHHSSPGAQAPH